ncbi:MAG: hypothetical protein LBE86_10670 [Gemmobacter sp.]|nr:hypothetical protein [Gemmobacter sp.]
MLALRIIGWVIIVLGAAPYLYDLHSYLLGEGIFAEGFPTRDRRLYFGLFANPLFAIAMGTLFLACDRALRLLAEIRDRLPPLDAGKAP